MIYKYYKNNRGVSLLELMVAMAIFSVLILLATGIFKMVVDGQRSAISAQNVQESMRYAMEKIGKEIRMAGISNKDCLPSGSNRIFNKTTDANGNDQLFFKNKNGICVTYYLENNRLKTTVVGVNSDFITPAKIEVSNLKLYLADDPIGGSNVQPYLTMVMDVMAIGPVTTQQKMNIQMTVSSRYYE